MRFALIGNDTDGLAMARALLASGRHELKRYSGPKLRVDERRGLPDDLKSSIDLEEVLADPAIDAVIVAGRIGERGQQLQRALQSERHVLCAHPAAPEPEVAYRASMIQSETGFVLLPLLAEMLHPALSRLRDLFDPATSSLPLGPMRLIEVERWSRGELLHNADVVDPKPCFPGWEVLRALGGDLTEVSVLAPGFEVAPGVPLLVLGRLAGDVLFEARYLPRQQQPRYRIKLIGDRGDAELLFPLGEMGPAVLSWSDEQGDLQEEYWDGYDPWAMMVERFEANVASNGEAVDAAPNWEDAIHNLELDAAARRSVERRRTVMMEYPDAGEDVNFKSTMTLVGCAILWIIILLAILSQWVSWFQWVVAGMLFVFLVSQLLRFVIPQRDESQSLNGKP